jgi:uncharacterized protein with ATP-grasp and redox domains
LQLEPECIGCLFDQVSRALKLLKPDISRNLILETQRNLMNYFLSCDIGEINSPLVGKIAYDLVAEALDVKDPYALIKKKQNQLALQFYDEAKKMVNFSTDPLFEAVIISALGNTIDLGTHHKIDFESDIKNFSRENLAINDFNKFKISLQKAKSLLFLLDNAGEIVFDKLLVETIQDLYPNLKIICSVRSSPIINDVTLDDANYVGLTDLVQVIEGSDTPGIDLPTSSDTFKEHFFLKDRLILSKGQGNFESLYGMKIPDNEIYYLLKAKCSLMERIFFVQEGSIILKKKTDEF